VLHLDPEAGRGEAGFGFSLGFHRLAPALQRAGIAALLRAAHDLRKPLKPRRRPPQAGAAGPCRLGGGAVLR